MRYFKKEEVFGRRMILELGKDRWRRDIAAEVKKKGYGKFNKRGGKPLYHPKGESKKKLNNAQEGNGIPRFWEGKTDQLRLSYGGEEKRSPPRRRTKTRKSACVTTVKAVPLNS